MADIDRGGAFAHLYGTWMLLPDEDQALVRGFVLNKFRGDPQLLAPAPQMLHEKTGVPIVACIPMQFGHGLPEEDGVFNDQSSQGVGQAIHTTIAIVAYPRLSNLDEFQPLLQLPGVRVVWARSPAQLKEADWIILPGSKATVSDLAWLRARGLDASVCEHVARGGRVLGVCGGLQMLGEALIDPESIDGNVPGLGLLPLVTVFEPLKTVTRASVQLPAMPAPWQALSGLELSVYEIHQGRTQVRQDMVAAAGQAHELLAEQAWCSADGLVLGWYWHGCFENASLLQAIWGSTSPNLDSVFANLCDGVDLWFSQPLPSC